MQIQLSERARERIEKLVRDGAYPSVEAAVEAAVDALEHPDFAGVDPKELTRQAHEARVAGRTRALDESYEAELRARLDAIVAVNRES